MADGAVSQCRISSDASVRLVCLPFAGGGSAAFFRWRAEVPAWMGLMPVTLPGHGGRLNERPFTDLRALVVLLADELQSALEKPFVLLGHSMGAWLVFELARELRRRGARLPELLVVAASRAPPAALTESPIHDLPDQEFLAALELRYGGVPTEVSASPELLQMLMPALRADMRMVETYQSADESPLETEILALGGTEDAAVSAAQLNGWRRHTTRACSVRLLPGGHFFLFGSGRGIGTSGKPAQSGVQSAALQIIVARIQQRLAAQPADGTSAKR